MKVEVQTYVHSANGLSLQLIPETEQEASLLHGFWKHGKLEFGHPCSAKFGTGYYIKWDQREEAAGEGEAG